MSPGALTVRDLTVAYGAHMALADVSFHVDPGTTLAVIGPNGSGKSTLLHAIVGLVDAPEGTIDRHGVRPALVLQSTDVDAAVPITVGDTVAMARYADLGLGRRFRPRDREAVRSALRRLDISDLAHRQLHALSGGQRQRAFVAQGLAQDAAVLLLDEPVTGLDIGSREAIMRVIDEERQAGHTVVTTTHNLEDARRCDRVLLLATRAIAFGPPDEVLVEEHLRAAFGGRVIRVGDGFVMDDPHHAH